MEADSGLRVARIGGNAVISWHLAPCATSSDVVIGALGGLPVRPGSGVESCLARDLPASTLTVTDTTTPLPGYGYWYLVRGRNALGVGPYGWQSNGTPEASTACP